jgi:predicted RNA-binding protein YlxR (DUF448 family)
MVPVRRCVGCRQSDSKDTLLRVVVQAGRVVIDESATLPGRGAYVHNDPSCIEASVRTKAWSRALRESGLDLEALAVLADSGETGETNRLNG